LIWCLYNFEVAVVKPRFMKVSLIKNTFLGISNPNNLLALPCFSTSF